MTRFARAKGSKSSNEKRPEEATSWLEMRRGMLTKPTQDVPENYRRDFIQKKEVNTVQKTEWASLGDESLLRPAYVFSPKIVEKTEWASLGNESLLRPAYVFSTKTVEQEPKGIKKKFNSGDGEQQSSNMTKKKKLSKVSIETTESSKNKKKLNNVNPDDVGGKIKKKKSGDVDTVSSIKKKLVIVKPDDVSNKIKKKKEKLGDVDSSYVNNVYPDDVGTKIKKKKSGDVDTVSNSKKKLSNVNPDDLNNKIKKKKKKLGDVDSSYVNNVYSDDVSSKIKKKKSGDVDTVSNSKKKLDNVNPDDLNNKIKKNKLGDVDSSCVEQPVKKKKLKNSDNVNESVKTKKKDKKINSLDSNNKINKKKRKLGDNDTESITKKKKTKLADNIETNNTKNSEQSGSKKFKKFDSKEPYFNHKPQFESRPYNKKYSRQFEDKRNQLSNKNYSDRKNPGVIDEIIVNGEKVSIVKFQGFPVTQEDAERLKKLRSQMIKEGIPKNRIEGAIKLERRRAEKALSRLKKAVCFHCRGSGHVLSNCPMLTDNPDTSTGICYKCGSTEHSALECKVVKGTNYQFAECFICKEQGHIARQCPDNPRGLYPQGGACRECGDVTHLRKDCPKVLSEKTEETITVGIRNDRNLECLDEEIKKREREGAKKPVKKNLKIKF